VIRLNGNHFGVKMDGNYPLRIALTRAQDDPVFRISLSYSAVIIYFIQYVVCQEKCIAVLEIASHLR
jgi:hypothetical protein